MESENSSKAESELSKATNIARAVQSSGVESKESFLEPKSEDEALIFYAKENGKWVEDYHQQYGTIPDATGVESEVYLTKDGRDVIKINSGFYHATWLDFFMRIETHNRYFPDTRYDIEGYTIRDKKLAVILKQPKIEFSRSATIDEIKNDLEQQGFKFIGVYKVIDEEYGIILRDFHAENVVMDKDGELRYLDILIQFTPDSKLPPSLTDFFPEEIE